MECWTKQFRGDSMDYGSFSTWPHDGVSHPCGNGIFHQCVSSGSLSDSYLPCDLGWRPFRRNPLLHRNTFSRSRYFPQFAPFVVDDGPNTTPEFPQNLDEPGCGFRPFPCLLSSEQSGNDGMVEFPDVADRNSCFPHRLYYPPLLFSCLNDSRV